MPLKGSVFMSSTKLSFIYKKKSEPPFFVSDHSHSGMELVFYNKADGTISINDKTYNFHDGCIAVTNAKTIHNENHKIPCDIIFMSFDFDIFHIPNGVYEPKNYFILEKIAQQIWKEQNTPQYAYQHLISAKIEELMILLVREINSYSFDEKIHDCMLYLEENFTTDINIKELAEQHEISYENFRHKFKKLYGISPKSFIISKRLSKASDMLIESDLSCTEIAYATGFSDSALLSKLFKQYFHISPQQFRRIYKENQHI